ncbi:MAG TPA: aminotransferase class III-fold pyridoxal phosphate-dependent enzyme [Gammaproteobacteria bacterium]|nr:aminotransferase class III-fold pyridoxal phosphate-dependent enzyme [Gammaproteobacteria bacterium]
MTGAHLDEVYPIMAFQPVRGHDVWLEDAAGRRVLDLYGGHAVAALGYGHPTLIEAIERQTEAMVFQSNAARLSVRDRAAEKLAAFAGLGLTRVFFVNSGAEANENALRLAFRVTGRKRVVAIEHGFHGRTAAAAAVSFGSDRGWYGFPSLPFEVSFVPRDDVDALTAAVDEDTAAVILEPVQGLAGAYDLAPEFLNAARSATRAAGAMLIFDEVQSGMGRLGAPFGANLYGIEPDLLTTAKGLAGGIPAGAVLMRPEITDGLKSGDLGTTFGGGPVAAAAIEAVIDTIAAESLLDNVRKVSERIRSTCLTGPVESMQGQGFLLGLKTRQPAAKLRDALLERDILTGTSADAHVLRLLPPLTLNSEHVERLATALGEIDA